MDTNRLYQDTFEDKLGLDVLGLESRFKSLVELINRTTLPTFSEYIPCYYTRILDPSDERYVVSRDRSHYGTEYYLRDEVMERFNLPVLDFHDCNFSDLSRSGLYGEIIARNNARDVYSVLMGSVMTTANTLIDSAIPFKPVYTYRSGNTFYLRNIPNTGPVEIVIRTVFPNIVSIPDEYFSSFQQLAIYDIKIKLWSELKYIEDVVTPQGNLQLKINDWESADKDREDWLERFRGKSFPDRNGHIYFTVL